MKRRIISLAAALAITASIMPMSAMAANVNKSTVDSVTNVQKHITIFGTRYITYDFNGMTVDSRYAGANYNRIAFELMSSSDKDKVADAYWPGADRTEQFGEAGVQAICDHENNKTGWMRGWQQYKDKLGNKYIPELREIYGGVEAEDDSNSFYNKELDRLTSFDEGTAAYTLLTKYDSYEEAAELVSLYHSIPEMMKVGKTAYDTCINSYYLSVAAGTKAMSTYILNTIVDNCIVPGTFAAPSATLAGARNAGWTMVLAARDTIRNRVSAITGKSFTFINERAREAMAGGGGTSPEEAAKAVKQFEQIIKENYTLATYCHDQSEKFKQHIASNAQSVIDEIEANKEKADDYYTKRDEEYNAKVSHTNHAADGVSRSNTYYSRIMAKKPTVDSNEDPELYNKQYEAWQKEIEACTNELNSDFDAWIEDSVDEIADMVSSMGYEVVVGMGRSNTEITSETTYFNLDYFPSRRPYTPAYFDYYWENEDMESFSDHLENKDDATMQLIEGEVPVAREHYESAIPKRDSVIASAKALHSKHESELKSFCAKAKGIADAWGFSVSSFESRGADILKKSLEIENWMNDFKDGNRAYWPYTSGFGEDYFRVKIKTIDSNLQTLREMRADYKEQMNKKINDYVELQNIDDELRSEYNEIVRERNAILDEVPDYVKEQELNGYRFRNVALVDLDVYTLTSRNSFINSKIYEINESISWDQEGAYEKRTRAKNEFLKQEANKLEPMYEKLRSLDRQREYIGDISVRINNGMYWTYSHNSLNDYNAERFGLDISGMHYGTAEERDSSWYTEEYDRSKRAMKLLVADFKGMGSGHMKFMTAYDSFKTKRAEVSRALKTGEMSAYGARQELYSPLNSAYNALTGNSYAYSFSGPTINIGEAGELELSQMYNAEDSKVQQVLKIADDPESYVPVEGIVSDELETMSETALSEGDKLRLSVSVYPKNATFPKVHWESLSPEIADVDENGLVTAYSEGTAVIRAVAEDAPLTEITDDDGNITGYETPDEFVKEFTIAVGSGYSYEAIGGSEDAGYSWANYGTAEEPHYISVTRDGSTKTVSARFNSNSDGSMAIMAVYDTDGGLIGVSLVNNTDTSRELSVSFDTDKAADRVKVFTWYGTQGMIPCSDAVIDEKIME